MGACPLNTVAHIKRTSSHRRPEASRLSLYPYPCPLFHECVRTRVENPVPGEQVPRARRSGALADGAGRPASVPASETPGVRLRSAPRHGERPRVEGQGEYAGVICSDCILASAQWLGATAIVSATRPKARFVLRWSIFALLLACFAPSFCRFPV